MVQEVALVVGTIPGSEPADRTHSYTHISKAAFHDVMFIASALEQNVFPFAKIFRIIPLDAESAKLSASLVNNRTSQLALEWRYVPALSILHTLQRIQGKTRTNKISSLDIRLRDDDKTVPKVLSPLGDTLNKLHSLEELKLEPFIMCDQNIWESIRQLPRLRSLSIPAYAGRPWLESCLMPRSGLGEGFPALSKFRCALSHATASRLFSPPTAKSALQEIHIIVYQLFDVNQTRALMTEIARTAPDLRYFGMDFTASEHALEIAVFASVLQLRSISSLVLRTDLAHDLTNEAFQLIVDAAPQLQVLDISPSTTPDSTRPLATLEVLNCIAHRCTSIQSICVHVDASNERLPKYSTQLEQLPETLTELNFGLSISDDSLNTALQLIRMLKHSQPHIYSFRTHNLLRRASHEGTRDGDAARRWYRVAEYVRRLRPFVDAVVQSALGAVQ